MIYHIQYQFLWPCSQEKSCLKVASRLSHLCHLKQKTRKNRGHFFSVVSHRKWWEHHTLQNDQQQKKLGNSIIHYIPFTPHTYIHMHTMFGIVHRDEFVMTFWRHRWIECDGCQKVMKLFLHQCIVTHTWLLLENRGMVHKVGPLMKDYTDEKPPLFLRHPFLKPFASYIHVSETLSKDHPFCKTSWL